MISVALATYNGGAFLREQLDSIVSQTILPDELVVRDDGSTDQTASILAEFRRRWPTRWKELPSGENLGSTKNFELVINHCEGDVIFLADQDDVWHPNKVATMMAALQHHPDAAFAFSNARLVNEEGRPTEGLLWEAVGFSPAKSPLMFPADFFARQLRGNVVTGATMAIRKRLVRTVPTFPKAWIHDAWIASYLSPFHAVVAIDQPTMDYRLHHSQQVGVTRGRFLVSGMFARSQAQALDAALQKRRNELVHLATAFLGKDTANGAAREVQHTIDHLDFRLKFRSARFSNISEAVKVFAKGDYARYSLGWKSFCRDLCAA